MIAEAAPRAWCCQDCSRGWKESSWLIAKDAASLPNSSPYAARATMTDMCELQLERGALVLRGFDDSPMSSAMSSARFYKLDRSALAERLPSSFAELDSLLGVETAAEHFHFANYLRMLLVKLNGEDWGYRIQDNLNNQPLVNYQAAVAEEDWRTVWDALLKPFAEQRTAYRRHYKTKKAPEIFFGVQARLRGAGPDACEVQVDVSPEHFAGSSSCFFGQITGSWVS